MMKLTIMLMLLAGGVLAGPMNLRNEKALKEWQADRDYRASPDYYSVEQFEADVKAAKNFAELQAVIAKKAKAEKAQKDAKKAVAGGEIITLTWRTPRRR